MYAEYTDKTFLGFNWNGKRKKNKILSELIIKRLDELDKNQSWLAEKLGVTRQAVSYYTQGIIVPKEDILNKLLSILNSGKKNKIKCLEDLLEE